MPLWAWMKVKIILKCCKIVKSTGDYNNNKFERKSQLKNIQTQTKFISIL